MLLCFRLKLGILSDAILQRKSIRKLFLCFESTREIKKKPQSMSGILQTTKSYTNKNILPGNALNICTFQLTHTSTSHCITSAVLMDLHLTIAWMHSSGKTAGGSETWCVLTYVTDSQRRRYRVVSHPNSLGLFFLNKRSIYIPYNPWICQLLTFLRTQLGTTNSSFSFVFQYGYLHGGV